MTRSQAKCPYCDFPGEDQIGDVYVVEIIEQYNIDDPSSVANFKYNAANQLREEMENE